MATFKYRESLNDPWKVMGYMNSEGSGGGLLPQIIAHDIIGSHITCTKGDISLAGHEVDGVWTFKIPEYGEWVVSNGYNTTTVTVDTVKQYVVDTNVQTVNYTMLYDYGDEHEDLTGGWTITGTRSQGAKNDSSITVKAVGDNAVCSVNTNTALDFTNYSALFAVTSDVTTIHNRYYLSFWSGNTTPVNNLYLAKNSSHTNQTFSPPKPILMSVPSSTQTLGFSTATGGSYSDSVNQFDVYSVGMAKSDRWDVLCDLSGISTPADLAALMEDAEALATILSNIQAVRAMIYTCTGDFMTNAVGSETFLATLEASPYKEAIYANEHWAKFLAMVT